MLLLIYFCAYTCICPRMLANDHLRNTWRNVSTCSVRLSVWCRKEMNHESGVHEEVSTCFLSFFFLEVSSARSKTRWRSVVQNLFSFISCLSFLKMVFPFPNCFPCSLQVQKEEACQDTSSSTSFSKSQCSELEEFCRRTLASHNWKGLCPCCKIQESVSMHTLKVLLACVQVTTSSIHEAASLRPP